MKLFPKIKEDIKKIKYFGIKCVLFSICYKITKLSFFAKLKHKSILNYLNNNLKEYLNDDIVEVQNSRIEDNSNIWVFWMQGFENAPELVKKCLHSIKCNCGRHPVIELTKDNIEEYITVPKVIKERLDSKAISLAQFSDYIRLTLLDKYGGIWMDSTMFLAGNFDEHMKDFSWYSIKNYPCKTIYVSDCKWTAFFMACGIDNSLVKKCRSLLIHYFEKNEMLIDYFLIDYIFSLVYTKYNWARDIINHVPNNNLNVYWLKDNLGEKFNRKEWDNITKNSHLFKLNHRLDTSTYDKYSYYNII